MMRPFGRTSFCVEQLGGDPLRRGEVDRDDGREGVPLHVHQPLVAGDAGVVHDDVDAAELVLDVLGDPLRRVLGGDVQGEVVAVQLAHHGLQLARGLRDVDAQDGGAVAVQHPRDLLADAAARAGHDRDLAGERPGPVLHLLGHGGGAVAADPDDLAGHVGRLRGEQERQRRGERAVGGGRDVHELDRAAAADLLAERAGEALERPLGDALTGGVRRLRGRAEHDDPRAGLEAAQQRGEELLELDEPVRGGDAGRVEDQPLVLLVGRDAGAVVLDRGDAEVVERGDHGLAQPAGAADDDRAADQRVALGPALEPDRVGQAEVLGQQLADGGVDQGLVTVAHRVLLLVALPGGALCNRLCNWESTLRDLGLSAFPSWPDRASMYPAVTMRHQAPGP